MKVGYTSNTMPTSKQLQYHSVLHRRFSNIPTSIKVSPSWNTGSWVTQNSICDNQILYSPKNSVTKQKHLN